MTRPRVKKKKSPIPAVLLALATLFLLYLGSFFLFPDIAALQKKNPDLTAFMKYRMAQWEDAGKKKRLDKRYVPYARIAPVMVRAIIIAEDAKFWRHEGFDFEAIHNAIEKNIETRRFKLGASTITQQLAKNLFLSPSKNPVRKIKEAILTWRIEKTLSKQRILELYLNVIEWGDGIFGVEAAARRYFGVGASELSSRQAAALASVVPNPLRYHPTSNQRYVVRRTDMIYKILEKRGVAASRNDNRRDSGADTGNPATSALTTELPLDDLIDSLSAIEKNAEAWFSDIP